MTSSATWCNKIWPFPEIRSYTWEPPFPSSSKHPGTETHMDKKNLLLIGSLSRQTGVHIKSLRYYDQIGILPPAYVDPGNGYRYYAFAQIHLVHAIQLCVELDISLSKFTEFLTEDKTRIHYGELIEYGTKLAEEKIKGIRSRLHMLKSLQKHLRWAEKTLLSENPREYSMPAKFCWIEPYHGAQHQADYYMACNRIFEDIDRCGLKIGSDSGLLLLYRNGCAEQFLYFDVDIPKSRRAKLNNVIHIPEGTYLCKIMDHSDIRKAPAEFPELFSQAYEKIVFETELFPEHYEYAKPVFELRCSLPEA